MVFVQGGWVISIMSPPGCGEMRYRKTLVARGCDNSHDYGIVLSLSAAAGEERRAVEYRDNENARAPISFKSA